MARGESRAGSAHSSERRRRRIVAGTVTCAAMGAALAHLIWPGLKIDTISVALFGAAVVPWLGDLFKSIELPGGTKFEFAELTERVEAAEETATRLSLKVDDAAVTARVALAAGTAGWEETDDSSAREAVERLSKEYVEVRNSMPSGSARTLRQERLFAELVKATSQVRDLDVEAMLRSENAGARLAACARLFSMPEPAQLDSLIDTALREKLPFNQYWELKAIGRLVDEQGAGQVPVGVVRRLRDVHRALPRHTDRAAVLEGVLAKFELN